MPIQLDHLLVPSKDKKAAAKLLAEILGVRWEPCGAKPVAPAAQPPEIDWQQYRAQRASVYVNDSLTIDFVDPGLFGAEGVRVPIHHYCFRVSDAGFDAILERVNHIGLKYWSDQQLGEPDYKINTRLGGRGFYFTEPDGHSWEILTVSYARPAN
jgi:catechol 2,3-dioxygenase-like lactoylglutathione lyase family enzyme